MTCAAPIDPVVIGTDNARNLVKSGMTLPIPIGASLGTLADELRDILALGINFVFLVVPNNTTAAYVDTILDTCELNGFKAMIGFEERLTDGPPWDLSPVTTAIVPNRNHPALSAFYGPDEPWEFSTTSRMQALYSDLNAAAMIPDVPIYINFSGGIENYQSSPTKQYTTGICDIVGVANLPFNDVGIPYDKETLYRRISYSKAKIMEVHEAASEPVVPIWTSFQVLGVSNSRFPTPQELLDHVEFQLGPLMRSYGPIDRFFWQRWHKKSAGETSDVLRNADILYKDLVAVMSGRGN